MMYQVFLSYLTVAHPQKKCQNYHLTPTLHSVKPYIRDTSDFRKKLKELGSAPQNVVLVTADVVRLYPNLGKFYLLPKILRRFYDAPGGPVISNWHTYKKISELPPKTHNPCIYQNLT